MPNPSDSRREAILDGIVTYLRGIDGNPDYYFDFASNTQLVQRFRLKAPTEFPCLVVRALEEELIGNILAGAVPLLQFDFKFAIEIMTMDVESTAPESIEKLIHDVRKKLLSTEAIRTHSRSVITTELTSISEPQISEVANGYITATIFGLVRHNIQSSNPSQST